MIVSKDNNQVKLFRKLAKKKWRYQENLVPLEGYRLIKEAYKSGAELKFILFNSRLIKNQDIFDLLKILEHMGIPIHEVKEEILREVAFTETPQGILGAAKFHILEIDTLFRSQKKLLIVFGVQDPGNLGTLMRSAEAFSWDALICLKGTVDPSNDKAIRSSMGSFFNLKISVDAAVPNLIDKARQYGCFIVAGDGRATLSVEEIRLNSTPIALLSGNEARGITEFPFHLCSRGMFKKVAIPMSARTDSLNVAVASSILMYELSKKIHNTG